MKIKELLNDILVMEFDKKKSKNKECLELGVEQGSLQKCMHPTKDPLLEILKFQDQISPRTKQASHQGTIHYLCLRLGLKRNIYLLTFSTNQPCEL